MRGLLRRTLALALAACLLAAQPALAAVQADGRIVKAATGPVSNVQFQKALSTQLSGFMRLPPNAGLAQLTLVSQNTAALPADAAAATTLLALLAAPEVASLAPAAREALALQLGTENLATIQVLARHLGDEAGRDRTLESRLGQLRAWFAPDGGTGPDVAAIGAALDHIFDGAAKDPSEPVAGAWKTGALTPESKLQRRDARTPAQIYASAVPDPRAIQTIQAERLDFDHAAAGLLHRETFVRGLRNAIYSLLEERQPRNGPAYVTALQEVFAFAQTAERDAEALAFVEAAARLDAQDYFARTPSEGLNYRLPPNALGTGEYWDLASGIHSGNFILSGLEAATRYRFFDVSPFVLEYLREIQRLALEKGVANAGNAEIVAQDVRTIARPSLPLAGIRAKNVHTYVPGFEKDLETMAGWIAEGGQLVIENDPGWQRHGIIEKLGPMIARLIAAGWSFRFRLYGDPGPTHNPHLETLTLTRPKAGQALASKDSWKDYVKRAVSGLSDFF